MRKRYFIDTEFTEKVKRPLFGNPYHFLQLISIGIVCDDGREYYAINRDFSRRQCNKWVKDNVLSKLEHPLSHQDFPRMSLWKNIGQIKSDIKLFMGFMDIVHGVGDMDHFIPKVPKEKPEIYAYYADYDWVAFCSIFGAMVDLPEGMPMYCRDLKQMMDEARLDKGWVEAVVPKQENEHNALDDAKWNKRLYDKMYVAGYLTESHYRP